MDVWLTTPRGFRPREKRTQ